MYKDANKAGQTGKWKHLVYESDEIHEHQKYKEDGITVGSNMIVSIVGTGVSKLIMITIMMIINMWISNFITAWKLLSDYLYCVNYFHISC